MYRYGAHATAMPCPLVRFPRSLFGECKGDLSPEEESLTGCMCLTRNMGTAFKPRRGESEGIAISEAQRFVRLGDLVVFTWEGFYRTIPTLCVGCEQSGETSSSFASGSRNAPILPDSVDMAKSCIPSYSVRFDTRASRRRRAKEPMKGMGGQSSAD
jgi:hypothetical protein